ncbi:hypothetical protein RFI_08168, partial [Reticulomyxa filosa]
WKKKVEEKCLEIAIVGMENVPMEKGGYKLQLSHKSIKDGYVHVLSPLSRICQTTGYKIQSVENEKSERKSDHERWREEPNLRQVLSLSKMCSPIKEFEEGNGSIYGFVSYVGDLNLTKGTHIWMRCIRVRDGSIANEEDALQVLIFGHESSDIPQVHEGDIIQIHGSHKQKHDGIPQCIMRFNKNSADPSYFIIRCGDPSKWNNNQSQHRSANITANEQLLRFLQTSDQQLSVHKVSTFYRYPWNPDIDPFICCHLFRLWHEWTQWKKASLLQSTPVTSCQPLLLQDITGVRKREHLVVMVCQSHCIIII